MKFLLRPLLSLVVLLLLLGGAELTVRLFFSESLKSKNIHAEAQRLYAGARMLEAVERDGLRYRGRPGAVVEIHGVRYEHNSLGLRGPELDPDPASRLFRILLLGDSNTYGWGVPFDQTFGQVAERLLNDRLATRRRIEVIDAGFVGYNSGDAEALYRSLEERVRPDLVLLVWFVNDLERFGFHVDRDSFL
ncbi:MAG: GDSL-type esterase/lipase family protein, partial [Planctomycetota bacterium]